MQGNRVKMTAQTGKAHVESGKYEAGGIRFGLSGCHDTSLASLLSSLGAFKGEDWPPYTSSIAFELFKASGTEEDAGKGGGSPKTDSNLSRLFSLLGLRTKTTHSSKESARKPTDDLSQDEKDALSGHYVRIRYNDRPMFVPGCKLPGKHLEGDESFCTLVGLALSYIARSF